MMTGSPSKSAARHATAGDSDNKSRGRDAMTITRRAMTPDSRIESGGRLSKLIPLRFRLHLTPAVAVLPSSLSYAAASRVTSRRGKLARQVRNAARRVRGARPSRSPFATSRCKHSPERPARRRTQRAGPDFARKLRPGRRTRSPSAMTKCRVYISCTRLRCTTARQATSLSNRLSRRSLGVGGCPSFAFPPSAIIRRKPLSSTARRAG